MSNFIQVDLQNLVRSIRLNENQYLVPLYEVVVNAIQAIHEGEVSNGKIDIYVKRDPNKQINISNNAEKITEIIGFEVIDNGIGFNQANRDSFSVAYTGHKASLGCKGLGRFLALSAFKNIEIDSNYFEILEKIYVRRTFQFDAKDRIHNEKISSSKFNQNKTSVKLNGFKSQFRKATPLENIANNLLHHCLIYFITESQPDITIYDESNEDPINLNQLFDKFFKIEEIEEKLSVGPERFDLNYVKNYAKGNGSHRIHFCGDKREVKTENLSKFIPVLEKRISEGDIGYYISVYVKGDYLNRNLTALRDEFIIPRNDNEKDAYNKVTFDEIGKEIAGKVKEQFNSEISIVTNNHRLNYKGFIYEKGLEYRHILQNESLLDTLKVTNNEKEKEVELHKLNYDIEHRQRLKVNEFLSSNDIKSSSEYKQLLEEILQEENQLGQSKLVNYMIHRKTVLNVLDKFIQLQIDGKYKLESDIHDIIFLREKTGTQIAFNEHNLWLLDERIAFSKYIASDKGLRETDFLISNSDNKPDLLIYDNKFVYGEENSSIVIFEFKRPMRNYFKQEEKNLGNQIKRYIKDLMSGKALDYRGRTTDINKETPKFGYIVCDYDIDIKNELEFEGYKKTPKGTYFKYEEGLNLFIEVMNYQQLLDDAHMRHKAFFSKLGLPFL